MFTYTIDEYLHKIQFCNDKVTFYNTCKTDKKISSFKNTKKSTYYLIKLR